MESEFKEEQREEIIDGKIAVMPFEWLKHAMVRSNVYWIFREYLDDKKCWAIPGGARVFLEEGKEEYHADTTVVCDREKLHEDGIHGAPDLVVEVLWPNTAKNDRGHKKDAYEKHGVREYWIVSPGDKSIEQYVLENGRFVLRDVYALCPPHMLKRMKESERAELVTEFQCTLFDDLTVRLEDVFRDIDFL